MVSNRVLHGGSARRAAGTAAQKLGASCEHRACIAQPAKRFLKHSFLMKMLQTR